MRHINTFENFDKINEEISNPILYHYTTLSNFYLILKSNKMIARHVGDSSSGEWRKISNKSISFCRTKLSLNQLYGIQDGVEEPIRILIYFDANKLKERYKLVPWSDSRSKSNEVNNSQFEERITSDITDVKKYITRVEIIYNQIISGVGGSVSSIKNDGIRLGGGKDDSFNDLPYDEFIKSEFLKKSLYSILSLDNKLKREYREIYNSIIKNTGRMARGNVILGSKLLICLWNWWLFNKLKSLCKGITFDYKNTDVKNYKIGNVKLNISYNDLIKSLTEIKDSLLKDFNKHYEDQINQITGREEYEKRHQKNIEKEEKEKEKKSIQEIRDKENRKKWEEERQIKLKKEYETKSEKEKEIFRKINLKINSELSKDKSYLSIIKWLDNSNFTILTNKSNAIQLLQELNYSLYKIKDTNLSSSIIEKLEEINKLIGNCREFNKINETIVKCKELMNQVNKSLYQVKTSTFSKIKKFLNI